MFSKTDMEHMVTSTICYDYCFSRPSDKIYVNVFCLQSINILIEKKPSKCNGICTAPAMQKHIPYCNK